MYPKNKKEEDAAIISPENVKSDKAKYTVTSSNIDDQIENFINTKDENYIPIITLIILAIFIVILINLYK